MDSNLVLLSMTYTLYEKHLNRFGEDFLDIWRRGKPPASYWIDALYFTHEDFEKLDGMLEILCREGLRYKKADAE